MTDNTQTSGRKLQWWLVALLIVGVFLGAFQFAQARSKTAALQGASAATGGTSLVGQGASGDPAASSGCACCGSTAPTEGGVTGDPVEGAAQVSGDVQTISIDLSKGYYEPNVIKLKAGVPAEITFGQSSGCTGQVTSEALGFFEDLTTGPKTVKLDALQPGEYQFSCGMAMVFGKIVVE